MGVIALGLLRPCKEEVEGKETATHRRVVLWYVLILININTCIVIQ